MQEKGKNKLEQIIDKYLNIILKIFFILFIVILITILISHFPNLDSTQKVFNILGSFSLGVAVLTYFNKKQQDETLAAIEQVSFFRKEIIPQFKTLDQKIRSKNKDYWFSRIRIEESTLKALVANDEMCDNFNNQLSIFFDRSDSSASNWKTDGEILSEQVALLNMLEELSLKVQYFKTIDHKALVSLNAVFVEMVEKNSVALFFTRDILTGSPVYDNVLFLYKSWKDLSQKPNMLKNLQKHGLLTKKQVNEVYENRKKKLGATA